MAINLDTLCCHPLSFDRIERPYQSPFCTRLIAPEQAMAQRDTFKKQASLREPQALSLQPEASSLQPASSSLQGVTSLHIDEIGMKKGSIKERLQPQPSVIGPQVAPLLLNLSSHWMKIHLNQMAKIAFSGTPALPLAQKLIEILVDKSFAIGTKRAMSLFNGFISGGSFSRLLPLIPPVSLQPLGYVKPALKGSPSGVPVSEGKNTLPLLEYGVTVKAVKSETKAFQESTASEENQEQPVNETLIPKHSAIASGFELPRKPDTPWHGRAESLFSLPYSINDFKAEQTRQDSLQDVKQRHTFSELKHNPYIDLPMPSKAQLEAKGRLMTATKTSLDHVLVDSNCLSQAKVKAFIPAEVRKNLSHLGISIEEDLSGNTVLVGKTGKRLEVSPEAIDLMSHNNLTNDFMKDCKKLREIQRHLFKVNQELGTNVGIDQLEDRYHLFGSEADVVASHFEPELSPIVHKVAEKMHVPLRNFSAIEKPKILLYTAQGGGGHIAQSRAIESYLLSKGFETKIICHDQSNFDALEYLTDGDFKESDSFNKVCQQKLDLFGAGQLQNDTQAWGEFQKYLDVVNWLWLLTGQSNRYELISQELEQDSNYVAVIDSFPVFSGIESAGTSNGVPTIRWATDFDVWPGLAQSYANMDTTRTAIALTSDDGIANSNLLDFSELSQLPLTQAQQGYYGPRFNPVAKATTERLQEQVLGDKGVYAAGYPIRSEIIKFDKARVERARQQLGLSSSDSLVTVMLGSQGKKELNDVVAMLLNSPPKGKSPEGQVMICVCVGRNAAIKDKIHQQIAQHPNSDKMNLVFADDFFASEDGYLNANQMNTLLNGSDLLISKPGGSTTAETLITQTPMLMCYLNGGETKNADFLQRKGLGELFEQDDKSLGQVSQQMLEHRDRYQLDDDYKVPSWQKSLDNMLESFNIPIAIK